MLKPFATVRRVLLRHGIQALAQAVGAAVRVRHERYHRRNRWLDVERGVGLSFHDSAVIEENDRPVLVSAPDCIDPGGLQG